MKKEEDWETVERKLRKGDITVRPRLRKALPEQDNVDHTIHYIILIGVLAVAAILLIGVCANSYLSRPDFNMDYYTNINEHPVEIRNITNYETINNFIEPDADLNCIRLQRAGETGFFLRCDVDD